MKMQNVLCLPISAYDPRWEQDNYLELTSTLGEREKRLCPNDLRPPSKLGFRAYHDILQISFDNVPDQIRQNQSSTWDKMLVCEMCFCYFTRLGFGLGFIKIALLDLDSRTLSWIIKVDAESLSAPVSQVISLPEAKVKSRVSGLWRIFASDYVTMNMQTVALHRQLG